MPPASRGLAAVGGDRLAQVGAHVEKLVLDPGERSGDAGIQLADRDRGADRAVRLVHVGVGREPWIGLGHLAHVAEPGHAAVAGAGVDPRKHDGGVFAVASHVPQPTVRRA